MCIRQVWCVLLKRATVTGRPSDTKSNVFVIQQPVADLGWSTGEGHFRSKGRDRHNLLKKGVAGRKLSRIPECSYITEDSYYIASNNCGAWKIIF